MTLKALGATSRRANKPYASPSLTQTLPFLMLARPSPTSPSISLYILRTPSVSACARSHGPDSTWGHQPPCQQALQACLFLVCIPTYVYIFVYISDPPPCVYSNGPEGAWGYQPPCQQALQAPARASLGSRRNERCAA